MYRKRLFARLPTTESDVFPLEFVLAGTNWDCCKSGIIIFTSSSHGHALRDGEISKFARSIGGKKAKSKKSMLEISKAGAVDEHVQNLQDKKLDTADSAKNEKVNQEANGSSAGEESLLTTIRMTSVTRETMEYPDDEMSSDAKSGNNKRLSMQRKYQYRMT